MNCPFCQRTSTTLYRGTTSRLRQCSCGAIFGFRFRPVWPLTPRLAFSRWEPIRRPIVAFYYAYVAFLRMVFSRLRDGTGGEDISRDARFAVPLCDQIRFWDELAEQRHREQMALPSASLLGKLLEQAMNPAIEFPRLPNLAQFHAVCDFSSWGLTRIADGQMAADAAQEFGYFLHNFPEGEGFMSAHAESQAAYQRAVAGDLPTPRRAEIKALVQPSPS
jgi:hypothetical protein